VRRLVLFITAVSVSAIWGLGCFASAPVEPSGEPEIPSREEVFESNRRQQPASAAQIAALTAYHQKACAPRPGVKRAEERRGRGCRFHGSADEITALERLREASVGTADEPRILERLIALWAEAGNDARRECEQFHVQPSMTVGELEDAQKTLFALEKLHEKATTEPPKLCDELQARFPEHVLREAACPGVTAPAPAPSAPAEPAAGDGAGWL
jgi:hypothetical protein